MRACARALSCNTGATGFAAVQRHRVLRRVGAASMLSGACEAPGYSCAPFAVKAAWWLALTAHRAVVPMRARLTTLAAVASAWVV